jgi:hypothetical protein
LVGGIRVEDLVNKLRQATGTQTPTGPTLETDKNLSLPQNPPPSAPDWFSSGKTTIHLDAREMLNRGEHPVGQVLADLHNMQAGEIYELVAPFFPAPLIDKASGIGFQNYVVENNPEEFRIYFTKQ